jgi:protein-S-isoprenylcysteine O-methyltransferase Ste14
MGFASNLAARWRVRLPWLGVPLFLWLARPSFRLLVAGAGLAIVSLAVRAWAAGTIHKDRVLTTTGPYAYVRNPLYLGSFLIGAGVALGSGSTLLLAVVLAFFALVYPRTVRAEERKLEALFGDAYRRYARAVPAFVPRFRAYTAAEAPARFSLACYRRNREYQAAFGVAAGFAALALRLIF